MTSPLVPARFLWRFSAPCRRREPLWAPKDAGLEESYRLPGLGELEQRVAWADVRAAWSAAGMVFSVDVRGKRRAPWCRPVAVRRQRRVAPLDRHPQRSRRSSCQPVLPPLRLSADRSALLWVAADQPCPRAAAARRAGRPCRPAADSAATAINWTAFVAAEALTGFDPAEHPQLGFTYAVLDRELGEQTFAVGSPLLYQEDPSLWATLELSSF